jgi:pimeloyl-ACP methyl ester carboxylesterase
MSEKYARANGLRLAYDEFGEPGQPVILLVMGLGTQMIAWPESFCRGLAQRGFHVIRFDNRDIGLSEKLDGARVPKIPGLALSSRLRLPTRVPYRLRDMAADTVGLLDSLGIPRAHFVGASMGGMIVQIVAAEHPDRVLSLTSIMSSSGDRRLPSARPEVMAAMLKRAVGIEKPDLENTVAFWRLIGSPAYQPSDAALIERIQASYQRSFYPQGYARQMAAIIADGSRVSLLKRIVQPTLVIHGKQDALVPVECGIDTARHIRGARLELIDGMGHDLPEPLLPRFVDLITGHALAGRG